MLTTAEASQAIADSMPTFDVEPVSVNDASGRILRQTVAAERDQPPFDRVTMDGIALKFASLAEGNRAFAIAGTEYAGDPVQTLASVNGCIEVMTGAVLPTGTDCVVPVERISVRDNVATVEDGYAAKQHQFVHAQGSDHRKDHPVLTPGSLIAPVDIAILASCGLENVEVSTMPVTRVISTGNELVAAGQPIEDHQIRLSNGPALVAMLREANIPDVAHLHLPDDKETLRSNLATQLVDADVLVLSGGVSVGKADFVPQVLEQLGVRLVFHKISQRPGKPMWFGIGPNNQAVFALPGNPVSSLVCCRQYVLPAIMAACGRRQSMQQTATLSKDVTCKADLTFFLPVHTSSNDDGVVSAAPVETNTSGDFAALGGTDGYVELRKDRSEFPAGTVVPLHLWLKP